MLTLGLISLIVNGLLFWLVAWISGLLGFGLIVVGDFWWGVLGAVVLGVIAWLIGIILRPFTAAPPVGTRSAWNVHVVTVEPGRDGVLLRDRVEAGELRAHLRRGRLVDRLRGRQVGAALVRRQRLVVGDRNAAPGTPAAPPAGGR